MVGIHNIQYEKEISCTIVRNRSRTHLKKFKNVLVPYWKGGYIFINVKYHVFSPCQFKFQLDKIANTEPFKN